MFQLRTLASGSSGNCLLLTDGQTHLLVDAGISARRIVKSLRETGVEPGELAGVLVTHEHSDHISGLATLTKQFSFPVFASGGTARALCYRIAFLENRIHTFRPGESFEVGAMGIETFATPHDTAQSTGYAVTAAGRKAAVVTDLGRVTEAVLAGVRGAHLLVAEANHDEEMVTSGPYPYFLKERILGDFGHLSNRAGGALACACAEVGTEKIILAHLSAENNTPALAYEAVSAALCARGADIGGTLSLSLAPRSEPGPLWEV